MIIAMDATAIGSGLGGDESMVTGLLRGLVTVMPDGDSLYLLASTDGQLPQEVTQDSRVKVFRVTRRPGILHFSVVLPRWLRSLARSAGRPDVVLTNTHAPLFAPAPVALMVTDLSFLHFPSGYPRATRMRLQLAVRHQVGRVAAVLTISEFCRRDLIASYGLDPALVHVIPLSADPPLPPVQAARDSLAARGVQAPYLAYLGNLHPRKNVAQTIRAFLAVRTEQPSMSGMALVIAGGKWFSGTDEAAAAAHAPVGAVTFLGRVDNDEREILLRDATALVYLSSFEGFGLPPLEAMIRGTPVLASDSTAIPEVCGDGALLVDPTDDAAVRSGIHRIALDPELRDSLRVNGLARAAHYTVHRTGTALSTALAEAVAGR